MPGYLPETDPVEFETFADAKEYLLDTMNRFSDSDYDVMDEVTVAETWDGIIDDLTHAIGDEWGDITGDDRLSFWITVGQ
jgi:hypothetical protein